MAKLRNDQLTIGLNGILLGLCCIFENSVQFEFDERNLNAFVLLSLKHVSYRYVVCVRVRVLVV